MVIENVLNDIEFLRFKNIYSINMHNKYWKSAKTSKDIEYITCLLNIVTCMPSSNFYKCDYCYTYVVNLAMHILIDCSDNNIKRSIFWDCVAIYFPTDILNDLQSQSNDDSAI